MSDTIHYQQTDTLAPAEPAPPEPCWDDPAQTIVDPANEPGPPSAPPATPPAVPLDVLVACLQALVVATREVRANEWTTWRVNLAGVVAVGVANRQPGRRSLLIVNRTTSAGTVYLCRQDATPDGPNTWPLAPGVGAKLEGTGPVTACTDAGVTAQLVVTAEYELGIEGL